MRKIPNPIKTGSAGDPQQTSLRDRFGSNDGHRPATQFEWDGVNPLLIAEAVARCVRGGDAIMFGRTRDGGAGVITVLSGDDRKRFYPADRESAEQAVNQVSYAYSNPEERRNFPDGFVPIGGKR